MKAVITIMAILILGMMLAGCTESTVRQAPDDPNAPKLINFLEPAEPNIVRDFGDTQETQKLYNLIKLRAMVLRDEKIISIIAGRLIELEQWRQKMPVFTKVDPNDPTILGWDISYLSAEELAADPNEPNEVVK